jgi:iron complex transport system ATP-binding protein
MTVYELAAFGRYPYLEWDVSLNEYDHSTIRESLETLGIGYLANMNVLELSDGQLQMAMIARALCQQTPIILLDEPTAHLDLNNRLEIMKHLKRFANEMNKAILVSTHELDLALQIADEVWLATATQEIVRGVPEDLVLNGSFDDIFRFKGFDLRTGRVAHPVKHKTLIILEGSGHDLLWTKNAFQRSGYEVKIMENKVDQIMGLHVKIDYEESQPRWVIASMKQQLAFKTIADLIEGVNSNVCNTHE